MPAYFSILSLHRTAKKMFCVGENLSDQISLSKEPQGVADNLDQMPLNWLFQWVSKYIWQ